MHAGDTRTHPVNRCDLTEPRPRPTVPADPGGHRERRVRLGAGRDHPGLGLRVRFRRARGQRVDDEGMSLAVAGGARRRSPRPCGRRVRSPTCQSPEQCRSSTDSKVTVSWRTRRGPRGTSLWGHSPCGPRGHGRHQTSGRHRVPMGRIQDSDSRCSNLRAASPPSCLAIASAAGMSRSSSSAAVTAWAACADRFGRPAAVTRFSRSAFAVREGEVLPADQQVPAGAEHRHRHGRAFRVPPWSGPSPRDWATPGPARLMVATRAHRTGHPAPGPRGCRRTPRPDPTPGPGAARRLPRRRGR